MTETRYEKHKQRRISEMRKRVIDTNIPEIIKKKEIQYGLREK